MQGRVGAILGSALFLVLAPGMVAGVLPWYLSHWEFGQPLLGAVVFRAAGAALILAGLPVLLDSFARFALQGLGTPAPVAPTRHLVVTGLYRRVRNPMYVAVTALILGQGLLFGSIPVLLYGLIAWLSMFAFVRFYEEPTLAAQFGEEYREFCRHVPRWLPRLKPYTPAP